MRGKRWLITLAVVIFLLLVLIVLNDPGSHVSPMSVEEENFSHVRHLAHAVKLYAVDHGGKYPVDLSELDPEYVANLRILLYSAMGPGEKFEPKDDWLYFASGSVSIHAPRVIIASPQAKTEGRPNKRVVVYGDWSTKTIGENRYQVELHQVIEYEKKGRN